MEDARRRATPKSNEQPQPQDPTPQRDHCIMLKTRAQGQAARDRIGKGEGEAGRRNKPDKSCRRDVRNGGDSGGKRGKHSQESAGSVAGDPVNIENSKQARREAQGTQGLWKDCTSRRSMSPLSRLIRGFRNKYNRFPPGRTNVSGI